MAKIHFITSWYEESNPERAKELLKCAENCIFSHEIDCVHLLCEDVAYGGASRPGLTLLNVIMKKRPTYTDFFEYVNVNVPYGDVAVIANTDIYPQEGVRQHLQTLTSEKCYALSRWDVVKGIPTLFDRQDSQDVWCFKAPIRPIKADFYTGICGCDNRIAFLIKEAGYSISNPAKTVKFNHLHESGVRNYDKKNIIAGPYHLIPTTRL